MKVSLSIVRCWFRISFILRHTLWCWFRISFILRHTLWHDGPLDFFSHFEGCDRGGTERVGYRHGPRLLFQRHGLRVPRDSIVIGSMETGKTLEPIQVARFVENLCVDFDSAMGRENPGATTTRLFGKCCMGRAVRSQEKLWRSASCGLHERLSMDLGLRTDTIEGNRRQSIRFGRRKKYWPQLLAS